MTGEPWESALELVVWVPAEGRAELKVLLDGEHLALAKHDRYGSCLKVGGGRVPSSGKYVVDALLRRDPVPDAVLDAALRARVLARVPLSHREGLLVFALACACMGALFVGFSKCPVEGIPRGSPAVAGVGMVVAWGLGALVLEAPLGGAAGGMARGLSLAIIEVGVALAFALRLGRPRIQLALHAPARASAASLLLAVAAAAGLSLAARFAMRLVPSTGEAPIETFVSWPSGALAFAALGMVVPVAEELLFRGFLYGALERQGAALAFGCSLLAFVAAHVQQVFGNWGALLAVSMTGAVLTGLRWFTGSTLVPAVAHLLYNFSLWMGAFG
jgi:membrane protease YdiL (CAAX protease family)